MDTKTVKSSTRRMSKFLAGMLLVLGMSAGALSAAQDQPTPALQIAKTYKPASLEHQYWHLLRWQNHLDKAAAEHEKQGKDGSWLRNHIQKELGFTDAEFTPVRDSAQRLEPKTTAIQGEMQSVITSDHALYAKHLIASLDEAPGRPKLEQLRQRLEAAIDTEIASLNTALGPEQAEKFKQYVQNHYSSPAAVREDRPALHLAQEQSKFKPQGAHQ